MKVHGKLNVSTQIGIYPLSKYILSLELCCCYCEINIPVWLTAPRNSNKPIIAWAAKWWQNNLTTVFPVVPGCNSP